MGLRSLLYSCIRFQPAVGNLRAQALCESDDTVDTEKRHRWRRDGETYKDKRQRHRQRQRQRQRQRGRDIDRGRGRGRDKGAETETETETATAKKAHTHTQTQTQRHRHAETHTDSDELTEGEGTRRHLPSMNSLSDRTPLPSTSSS